MGAELQELDQLRQKVIQLEQELALYQALFACSPVGTFVYKLEDSNDDRSLRLVAANPVVEALANIVPAELVGKTLDENFPGLREQGIPQAYAQVIRTGTPFSTESVYGDERVITSAFDVHAVPLPEQHVAVMFENITARKQAEQSLSQINAELEQRIAERTAELRHNQMLLRSVLDNSPAAIYIKDLNGTFLAVNQKTAALLNITPEEMQGRRDTDLFPAEFVAQWRANEQQAIATGTAVILEETVNQPDGMHYFLSVRTPLYDDAGQIYAISGVSTDITERKQREAELRVFKALADNAFDGIAMADLDGTLTYINPACKAMFQLPEIEAGLSALSLYPAELGMDTLLQREIVPTIMERGAWIQEIELPRPNGSRWISQNNVFAVRDEQGKPIKIANLLRDVTAQRRQEAEREALQQQLITAQRHALRELSTPLIPISERVVIMPLIGAIDSDRARQVMETLLEGVAKHRAELAILDITGVQVVDTQVAQAFIQAAQAVRLLGAQVMITGIQPQIAQTLVHLGVDLSGILTRGSLQAGIAAALHGAEHHPTG